VLDSIARSPLVGSVETRKRQQDIGIRTVMHLHEHTHTKEIRKLCGAGKLTSQGTKTQSRTVILFFCKPWTTH